MSSPDDEPGGWLRVTLLFYAETLPGAVADAQGDAGTPSVFAWPFRRRRWPTDWPIGPLRKGSEARPTAAAVEEIAEGADGLCLVGQLGRGRKASDVEVGQEVPPVATAVAIRSARARTARRADLVGDLRRIGANVTKPIAAL